MQHGIEQTSDQYVQFKNGQISDRNLVVDPTIGANGMQVWNFVTTSDLNTKGHVHVTYGHSSQ
jgi:hypothetical protein